MKEYIQSKSYETAIVSGCTDNCRFKHVTVTSVWVFMQHMNSLCNGVAKIDTLCAKPKFVHIA